MTGVEISAAGVALEDEHEAHIAWFLMLFGDWPAMEQVRFADGVLRAIEISVSPPPENLELVKRQGFAGIQMLSSLYSSMYNEMTLTTSGDVRELRHEPDPGELAALIPDDYWDREDRALPLWRLHIKPPRHAGRGQLVRALGHWPGHALKPRKTAWRCRPPKPAADGDDTATAVRRRRTT